MYLEDVIIFSTNMDDHIRHVDKILTSLQEAGVTLTINKGLFFQRKVEYLGHMITSGQLEIDQKNFHSLKQAKHPRNKTELR